MLLLQGAIVHADYPSLSRNSSQYHPEGPTALPLKPAYLNHFVDEAPAVPVESIPDTAKSEASPTTATASADSQSNASESSAQTSTADTPQGKAQDADSGKSAAELTVEKPKRQLSPALTPLRDQVRQILTQQQKQSFNTRDNLPTDLLNVCLGFGCDTEVAMEGPGSKKINGITCLCWNYPCGGYEMLALTQNHIAARIGYGYQSQPGEFLAILAMSRVPATYPLRSGNASRTVADLVAAEKLACREKTDMSLRLIGLTYYVDEPQWKNDLGEDWSLERIIRQEISQPIVTAPDGGLNRLTGLSYAVIHHINHGQPVTGQYQRAQKYIGDFHNFALALQNSDGTWGPALLATKSESQDASSQIASTGRVLEWLVLSLPANQLEDPRIIRSVEQTVHLLGLQRYQRNVPYLPSRELAAFGHAIHALTVYNERVFKPTDSEPASTAEQSSPAENRASESPTSRSKSATTTYGYGNSAHSTR
jgi:hypothetical protein